MILWLTLACSCSRSDRTPAADSGASTGCEEDVAVFTEHVWTPVLSQQCVGCHVAGGPAAGTALLLDPDDMLASLRAASAVGERLLLKPTGQHESGHGGGTLVTEAGPAYEALALWVRWGQGECTLPDGDDCSEALLPRRLRRLSHDAYDQTLSDLLEIDSRYGQQLAADPTVDGYDNDAATLTVSGLLADQYRSTAEELVATLDVESLHACDPSQAGYTACAVRFIEAVGLRTFRRPLSADELDRYLVLWKSVAVDDGHPEGLRWVLIAMLQSPHFLYRSELGVKGEDGIFTLTDWEVASVLSYLLWGTMPDETLLIEAEAGALQTRPEIQAQIDRMADDERVVETATEFVRIWLQLDRLPSVSRDGLTDALRESMADEVTALIEETVSEDGSLTDLLSSRAAWLDAEMAAHYGVSETGWVELDGVEYSGLLTRAAVLTTHGLSSGSGPVQRGVLVRERLLCEPLAPPPSDIDTSPPEADASASTREHYEAHSTDPQCASCHNLIDPLGFAFEHHDQLGQWRAREGEHEIDASGALDGVAFDGPAALTAALLDDARLYGCFDQSWRRWASGAETCGDGGGADSLTAPLLDLLHQEDLALRTGAADEGDTLASGVRLSLEELPEDDVDYSGAVVLELIEVDAWGDGYCADATVTNAGDEAVEWEVRTTLSAEISSLWNAEAWQEGDETVFVGVSWSAILAPGESTSFGFCATY